MTMRKALARAPGASGRATGPRTGPAPGLVIDDEPAGATTLGWLTDDRLRS